MSRTSRLFVRVGIALLLAVSSRPLIAADGLELYRGARQPGDSTTRFVVRGARPGEPVMLLVVTASTENPIETATLVDTKRADRAGGVFFELARGAIPEDEALQARALVQRRDVASPILSNALALRPEPALDLLVDDAGGAARVLRFTPDGGLDVLRRESTDRDGVLAALESGAVAQDRGVLVATDGRPIDRFGPLERTVDLLTTPDESALVALTSEPLPSGASLLRLRLLDALSPSRSVGSIEVLRGVARTETAYLVPSSDSHRVFVVDPAGSVREVMLGAELVRGITLLPFVAESDAAGSPRELLRKLRAWGDRLVAVVRNDDRSRGDRSRIVSADLRRRAALVEWPVAGRIVDFDVVEREGHPFVIASIEEGGLLLVDLESGATDSIALPGATLVEADARRRDVYVVSSSAQGSVVSHLDVATRTLAPLALEGIAPSVVQCGLFGDDERPWLYVVDRGESATDDRLLTLELDPDSGLAATAANFGVESLHGRVRRLAAR